MPYIAASGCSEDTLLGTGIDCTSSMLDQCRVDRIGTRHAALGVGDGIVDITSGIRVTSVFDKYHIGSAIAIAAKGQKDIVLTLTFVNTYGGHRTCEHVAIRSIDCFVTRKAEEGVDIQLVFHQRKIVHICIGDVVYTDNEALVGGIVAYDSEDALTVTAECDMVDAVTLRCIVKR